MDIHSPHLRHVSEERQQLKVIMLEIQRLRRLVVLAKVEVRNRQDSKKVRPARRKDLRLAVDAGIGRTANSL
jgi:hypothetical protein